MKPLLLQLRDGAADLLDDHRRQPLGRLVEQEQLRAGAQDPADRQHLLLAAESLVPWLAKRSAGSGTAGRISLDREAARADHAAAASGSPRRSGWRRCPAPRDRGDAQPGDPVRGQADRLLPSNRLSPSRLPTIPMIDFMVVVLPAPLRPSSVTTSPSRTSKPTPCRMCDSPYQAWRSRTSSSGAGVPTPAATPPGSAMARPHVGLDHLRVLRHRS